MTEVTSLRTPMIMKQMQFLRQ